MTDDEALHLWAFQWMTHDERPRDLPQDTEFIAINRNATSVMYTLWDQPTNAEYIILHKFVIESADAIKTCRAGYGEQTNTLVVTPVEIHPRYDLATQEAQP